ncbi:peptide deformylase [Candidatus Parcubacteria bacterium]|nr:MAG: peptide deformylase [Candidatus Parcubacteria bacterium]
MSEVKPIVKNPNPVLRQKAKLVPPKKISEEEFTEIIGNMKSTLNATPNGIGLAAPQIGHSWRIFIVKIPEYEGVFINPEIMDIGKRTTLLEEGCLSVTDTYGPVARPKTIKIKALNEQGLPFKVRAKGLLARVIQHEIDHLDGTLFIDKAEKTYRVERQNQITGNE